jgi:hypothetical protein
MLQQLSPIPVEQQQQMPQLDASKQQTRFDYRQE